MTNTGILASYRVDVKGRLNHDLLWRRDWGVGIGDWEESGSKLGIGDFNTDLKLPNPHCPLSPEGAPSSPVTRPRAQRPV